MPGWFADCLQGQAAHLLMACTQPCDEHQPCACAALGGLLSWLSGMPLWGGVLIVAGALFVNSLVADIEDEAPGGFLNPREKDK